jgi:V8-like Glu-specific endopeptidase
MCARAPLAVIAALALIGICAASATADPAAPPGTPTAKPVPGTSRVGPLFASGTDAQHGCTASVLASSSRDLIVTAAHCVNGTAAGMRFAPGYDRGATPYGVWTVTRAYVDPAWVTSQDPNHDYAILRVAKKRSSHRPTGVEDVTGGAVLGTAPSDGTPITDVAYNAGINDQPISCTTAAHQTSAGPSFDCHGYVSGSSGSPWLSGDPDGDGTAVLGVIGGQNEGGCFDFTSYSAPFDPDVIALLQRAERGDTPDVVPLSGGSGC